MSEPENKEPGQAGRPPFEPTAEHRLQVEVGAYTGMSEPQIAASLEISVPTLRKYFYDELFNGHSKERAYCMMQLRKAVSEGNVSAIKHYEQLGAMTVAPDIPGRPEPLGKKEEANLAAQQAPPEGSKWRLLN